MSAPIPKASLYFYSKSIWASVPLLALEEKGYGSDEVDLKAVDLSKADNYATSYLRLNPKATVPTLVVPLQTTLGPDIESRYKAIQDTKSIVEFLDKSRSTQSRTHTTSTAPSPSLSPATIAYNATSNKVVDALHSPAADPNALTYLNARDDAALQRLAAARLPMLVARRDKISQLLSDNEAAIVRVSEKTKTFWETKRAATEALLQVFADGDISRAELSKEARNNREEYFNKANAAWTALKDVLTQLSQDMIGPYVLGDQLSIADLHLAAWLARLATLSGGSLTDDGNTVVAKLEAYVGTGFSLQKDFSVAEARRRAGLLSTGPETSERQTRLAAFWDAVKERPSFKKVYSEGLH